MAEMPERSGEDSGGTAKIPASAHQADAVRPTDADASTAINMEEVVSRENMLKAFYRVYSNKGAPGVDGVSVQDLSSQIKTQWSKTREQLLTGTYLPQPVRKVEIPEPSGG